MSTKEEDEYWEEKPNNKGFNFDYEEQGITNVVNQTSATSSQSPNSNSSGIKTLDSILAARSSSNEPFLKPSMIMCNGDKIENLIEHLNKCYSTPKVSKPKQNPKTYISDIVHKREQIDFSPYKSKSDKLLLLDCAICCSDGNTITAAAIFISKTLKPSLFIEEMRKRPIAVNHYINYLEMSGRSREVAELIKKLSSSS